MRTLTLAEQQAYEEGHRAGLESMSMKGYEMNPYAEDTPEAIQWGLGWCKGYADTPVAYMPHDPIA